jgi:hypothetical protein
MGNIAVKIGMSPSLVGNSLPPVCVIWKLSDVVLWRNLGFIVGYLGLHFPRIKSRNNYALLMKH